MKAGTVITCPKCEAAQIKSTKDVLPGGQTRDAEFVSMGYDMKLGNGCYKCGTPFIRKHPKFKFTQLHTETEGWKALTKVKPQPKQHPKPKLIT